MAAAKGEDGVASNDEPLMAAICANQEALRQALLAGLSAKQAAGVAFDVQDLTPSKPDDDMFGQMFGCCAPRSNGLSLNDQLRRGLRGA